MDHECFLFLGVLRSGNVDAVRTALDQEKGKRGHVSITTRFEAANTPLHIASKYGHYELVRFLLERGSDVNSFNVNNDTPLHVACREDAASVVKELLRWKALVNATNKKDQTPLMVCAINGSKDCMRLIVKRSGLEIDLLDRDGFTALHYAVVRGQRVPVFELLDAGASCLILSKDGRSPLVMALEEFCHTPAPVESAMRLKAILQRGKQYVEMKDPVLHERAVMLFRFGAAMGHVPSSYMLATCYERGIGVEKNEDNSLRWHVVAAEGGNGMSACRVGIAVMNGWGDREPSWAIRMLEQAARSGDTKAMWHLGRHFERGYGGSEVQRSQSRNLDTAMEWYRRAQMAGDGNGAFYLGNLYDRGEYFAQDSIRAVQYYEEGVRLDDIRCAVKLGRIFRDGSSDGLVHRNVKRAKEMLEKAASKGRVDAMVLLGQLLEYEGKVLSEHNEAVKAEHSLREAMRFFSNAAEKGSSIACFKLAALHRDPILTKKKSPADGDDSALSVRFLEMAIKLHGDNENRHNEHDLEEDVFELDMGNGLENLESCPLGETYYDLGLIFMNEGRESDRSIELMRMSAENRFPPGMTVYGEILLQSTGATEKETEENRRVGKEWISEAAHEGDARAMVLFGVILWEGKICTASPDRSIRLWKDALAKNDGMGLYYLAVAHLDGRDGVLAPDVVRGMEMMRRAAEFYSIPEAMVHLGQTLSGGKYGVNEDTRADFGWVQKAADLGNVDAAYLCGRMIEGGQGTDRNIEEAKKYYKSAMDGGHELGAKAFDRLKSLHDATA